MVISSAYDGSGTDELILTGSSVLLENENVLPLRLSGDDEDFNLDEDLSDPAFDDDDDDDEPYYDDEF